jgi:hypothetical protein
MKEFYRENLASSCYRTQCRRRKRRRNFRD